MQEFAVEEDVRLSWSDHGGDESVSLLQELAQEPPLLLMTAIGPDEDVEIIKRNNTASRT
jgi:hypothetical protein